MKCSFEVTQDKVWCYCSDVYETICKGHVNCFFYQPVEEKKEPVSISQGTKHDQHKLRLDLFPFTTMIATSDILTGGAVEYTARNWEKGLGYNRVFGALLRHLLRWYYRINIDTKSGRPHIDHAACELAFLQHFEITGTGIDDRPVLAPEAIERLEEMFDRWEKQDES